MALITPGSCGLQPPSWGDSVTLEQMALADVQEAIYAQRMKPRRCISARVLEVRNEPLIITSSLWPSRSNNRAHVARTGHADAVSARDHSVLFAYHSSRCKTSFCIPQGAIVCPTGSWDRSSSLEADEEGSLFSAQGR